MGNLVLSGTPLGPKDRIAVLPAFARVNSLLLELLRTLSPQQWLLPTVHPTRDVKDLVAHLVDGSMRRLSLQRDGFRGPPPPIDGYQSLVDYIQRINREWMAAARRLSPRILIGLAQRYDAELLVLLESLPPDSEAVLGVAWAGEERSQHWFDTAREYTEKWHHQQQIRDAVGAMPLYEPALLGPVLETFARGLPHAYRGVDAPDGTCVAIEIGGPVRCGWTLLRQDRGWQLHQGLASDAAAWVRMDADRAWRLWTKGLTPEQTAAALQREGPPELSAALVGHTAIMA